MPFSPDLLHGWWQENSVEAQTQEMFGKPPKFKLLRVFTNKHSSVSGIDDSHAEET